MAMFIRPVTAAEYAAHAFDRWQSQYQHWKDDDKTSDGVSKEERRVFFNTHEHTPANVAKTLNTGWAYPECSGCKERFPVVAQFKAEWSEETWTLCLPCADRVASLLRQFDGAAVAVKS